MNPERFAFIIRIWHEAEPEEPQLRGSVQLVSSEDKAYFSSLDEVPKLLRQLAELDEKRINR